MYPDAKSAGSAGETDIAREVQISHDAISLHVDVIGNLERRLQAILRGSTPPTLQGAEAKRSEPSTKLGCELRTDSDRIKQATNQLSDIISRLEV